MRRLSVGQHGLVVAPFLRKFTSRGDALVHASLQSRHQPVLLHARGAAAAARQQPDALRTQDQQAKRLSTLVSQSNLQTHPHNLPKVIVAAQKIARPQDNRELLEWLSEATREVQKLEDPLMVGGHIGLLTTAIGARKLRVEQGQMLASTVFSILAATVPRLDDSALAHLSFQMLTQRVGESSVWKAIFETVEGRSHIDKNEAVRLLNNLRQARILGHRHDQALAHLAQQLVRPSQANESPLDSERLVQALASLTRLQSHVEPEALQLVLHKLLDQWLDIQAQLGTDFEKTPASQLLSLFVSFTSMRGYTHHNMRPMLVGASRWLEKRLRPTTTPGDDPLPLEEAFIMVWALQELTPTGLKDYTSLTQVALARLRVSSDLENFSPLRLKQLSEVLLSARHALGKEDTDLEDRTADSLAKHLVDGKCPLDVLIRTMAVWNQAGSKFWNNHTNLAEAIMHRATNFAEDSEKVSMAELASLLETLTKSCFAASERYQAQRGTLLKAVLSRTDSNNNLLARSISLLESGEIPVLPGYYPPGSEEAKADDGAESEVHPEKGETAADRRSGPPLPAGELVLELGKLCREKATNGEIAGVAQLLLSNIDQLKPEQARAALEVVLASSRHVRQIDAVPSLSEVLERLGDMVAMQAATLPPLVLIDLLNKFAELRQPHFFFFERALAVLLTQHSTQGMTAGQVLPILEAFVTTRLNLPQLSQLVLKLRTSTELDRMPTMQLIQFLGVTTSLDALERPQQDVQELVTRILAETSDNKALPVEGIATILSSVYLSGVTLPDSDLRRLLSWLARDYGAEYLNEAETAGFRLFFLAQMAKTDRFASDCLSRMLVDVQRFVRALMQHESATANVPSSKLGRDFKNEVMNTCLAHKAPCQVVSLGPAGTLDLQIGSTGYFLHGPETFFGPSVARTSLRMTPQEQRRCWLLQRLLSDAGTRKRVQDFYPEAKEWPRIKEFRHISWLTWHWADDAERRSLLGLAPTTTTPVRTTAGAAGGGSAAKR